MESLLKAIGLIVLVIGLAFLSGLVLSVLWGWFMVRMGLPSITVPQALGLSLVVTFLTYKPSTDKDITAAEKFVVALLSYAFYLAYGFIITLFL